MSQERAQRKLTTILVADVAGFSHLMHEHEEETLRALDICRGHIGRLVTEHDGRIFNTGGDSVLVEFGSAVEAVRCAVAIQTEFSDGGSGPDDVIALTFRIGINIGDVMIRGDDLFGDGVNVAARLEGLAEPGGVCVSGNVFEQVKNKIRSRFEDIGAQSVKNIAEPVQVYRIVMDAHPLSPAGIPTRAPKRVSIAFAAVAGFLFLATVAAWQIQKPGTLPAEPGDMTLALPNKPSIAVLPFTNTGAAVEQEMLSDGIVRDVITDLSAFADLMVIASASSFSYKGKPTDIAQVSRELGVRFVLDGSTQAVGDNVRINIQLVDAISGEQLWAERYDRKIEDIFVIQDEITQNVVAVLGAMEGPIALADRARVRAKRATDLTAYEYVLLARDSRNQWTAEGNEKSLELVQKAIEADPLYARAYVEQAWTYFQDATRYRTGPTKETAQKALESALKAIELDETFAEGYWVAGDVYAWLFQQPEKALASYDRALALNPNHADILAAWGGWILPTVLNRPEDGIEVMQRAMRLSPFHEDWYNWGLMNAYFVARQFDDAVLVFQRIGRPSLGFRLRLAASYAYLGRTDEAQQAAEDILERKPDFSIDAYLTASGAYETYADLLREGLLLAGLPE